MKIVAALLVGLISSASPLAAHIQPPPPQGEQDKPEACDSNGEACPQDAQPQQSPEPDAQTLASKPAEPAEEPCDSNGEACPQDAKPNSAGNGATGRI